MPGLAGAGVAQAIEIVSPSKKLKWVKRGAEGLDDVGDAAKAERLAREAKEKQ